MTPTNSKPRVKICCIASHEEASMAIGYGASAIGLVSAMPSGPGVIPEETIRQIAQKIPPAIGSFLLTSRVDAASIIAQQHRCRTNTLQFCDHLDYKHYAELREALPGIALVQVIHVQGEESTHEAKRVAHYVDALLLDSGNQNLSIKELGGTGRVHDWSISKRIRSSVDIPIFLAGGLTPDNISKAIVEVRPFGVDVCSGVRTNGKLDAAKLEAFFHAMNHR
jgi:phosphoribosylanthranilate isomerase